MDVINLVKQQASLIRDLPIGTAEWAVMFKNLKRLAAIALLENFVPRKSSESVWDTNKFAVRALLEGAKAPVLIQILDSFYKWKINSLTKPSLIDDVAKGLSLPKAEFVKQLEAFEFSSGSLLYCCFVNVESHQSVSNDKFIDYMVFIYDSVKQNTSLFTNFTLKDRAQPVMGFMYMLLMLREDQDLPNEKEFWKSMGDKLLLAKMIEFFMGYHTQIPAHIISFMLESLANIFKHEMFDYDKHFAAATSIEPALKDLKAFVAEFINKNTSKRALLQPISKVLAKLK